MEIAYLFPGQGAQAVGMGKDLYEVFPAAARVFDQAEEITSLPLKRLCFQGPAEELSRTDIAQPAIFTVSAALLACTDDLLSPERLAAMAPTCAAGLSLGEYTALYAAGAMDFAEALRLVARRGELMQQAATAIPSGMVTLLGLAEPAARELCDAVSEGQVITCANFNCPGQIVLSGERGACDRAAQRAESFGAKAAIPLKVAGAFHSELMRPAAEGLAEAMASVTFREPAFPVLANVDAQCYRRGDEIPAKLLAQLTCPVRWQQCMEFLVDRPVEKHYEIGPGRVLAGLMRRIHRRADLTSLNGRGALEKLVGE